jgi:hypothetical protein
MSNTVKRVFVLSQYGVERTYSSLIGVYTRKDQIYKAMLILANFKGNLDDYNENGLPGVFLADGREANYRRVCNELKKLPRRIQLFDSIGEALFNVWECPLNYQPNVFRKEGETDCKAWWDQMRFVYDDEEEEEDDDE